MTAQQCPTCKAWNERGLVDAEATVNYHARQTESPETQKREEDEP